MTHTIECTSQPVFSYNYLKEFCPSIEITVGITQKMNYQKSYKKLLSKNYLTIPPLNGKIGEIPLPKKENWY